MDTILEIRKYIGHKTLVIPHSVTLVFDEQNRILVEERADDGMVDFPGGGIEPDETIEDAAIRELKEETGIIADELKLFKVYSGPLTHYVYSNGDEISGIDCVFVVTKYHGDLKPQKEEVTKLMFVEANSIDKNKLSIRNKRIIEDIKHS